MTNIPNPRTPAEFLSEALEARGSATKPLTAGLPDRCPSWCIQGSAGHQQALDEGCTIEEAREHISEDRGEILPHISNPFTDHVLREGGASWRAELHADNLPGWYGRPYVRLEVSSSKRPIEFLHLDMTTGEVRDLAAALLQCAEAATA